MITSKELSQRMNRRLKQITPSRIRSFDEAISQIPGIIKLTLGEPDFNTPAHIKQAAMDSLNANHTHYPQAKGTPALRTAAAQFLNQKYHLHYTPEQVLVTVGASEAIWVALGSIINPGDYIIIPTPIWPQYIATIRLHGGIPIFINTAPNDFKLTPKAVQQVFAQYGTKIKGIVLNFPSNPTGITYQASELAALAEIFKQQPLFVISDEVYSEISYMTPHISMAQFLPEQTLLINGVSKSHAMTGWRIGLLCAPTNIQTKLFKFHQASVTSAAYITQDAATEALAKGLTDSIQMKAQYQQRRDFVYHALIQMGFTMIQPQGAFYAFCKLPDWLNETDETFCQRLAQTQRVAVVPGTPFGPGGEGYIRISYAAALPLLQEAMARIDTYLQQRHLERML